MRRRFVVGTALAGVLLAGCTPTPSPTPTPTVTPREFTVITTEPVAVTDPAGVRRDTDALVVINNFERLMVVYPTKAELKPALATDCLFRTETVYECTLPKDLKFHNGRALTSSDVKFSIERAYRLGIAETSISLLDSLDKIETPDELTVRFSLKWPDSQFGYALATPAASIVDEESYDPDALQPLNVLPVGSGPYQAKTVAADRIVFDRYNRDDGANNDLIPTIVLRVVPDSAAAEAAINEGTADVVWRSLDDPALARLGAEISASTDKRTKKGYARVAMTGTRIETVRWNAASKYRADAALRAAVALSLQADRTLASLVPNGMTGQVAAFPVGGTPAITKTGSTRLKLTLGYSSKSPGASDLARTIRDRVENLVGVSLQLKVGSTDTDLILSDAQPWLNTPLGWLQAYLDAPLPGVEAKLLELEMRVRSTTDATARLVALGEIQKQSAADVTVLPISQTDGILFLGKGVSINGEPFGAGYQLTLWGMRRG